MLISEIYQSLQGEGLYSGHPSIFIRTAGCNLRCVWCDTPHTSWEPTGEPTEISAILEQTEQWANVEHVVITGGEPMIQQDLTELVDALRERGRFITIETAGTSYDSQVRPQFFSISPKLRNSYPGAQHPAEQALHSRNNLFDHLLEFVDSGVDYQFKFVVETDSDTPEILELIDRFRIPGDKVNLMPQATTAEELAARGRLVASICRREGLTFTGRLQIELWGNERAR